MSETETEAVEPTEEEQLDSICAELQKIKAPLDEARTKSQQEAAKLRASIRGKIDKLKVEIRESHDRIRPIDELMRTAAAAKRLRGSIRTKVLSDVQKALEAIK